MTGIAAENEEIGRLLHISGFGVITAVTVYAAIGDIGRFAEPKKLVGYAGLGARVHDSGMTTRTGKITKAGRRDLRVALVEAAHVAANSHPHWKAELARLQPRLGYNKAIVAIARKLLITVWYVLASARADQIRRAGSGGAEDAEVCLRSWKGKSSRRTNGCAICARTTGCFGLGSGVDQHPLGLEEADPIAALELKRKERRPKH